MEEIMTGVSAQKSSSHSRAAAATVADVMRPPPTTVHQHDHAAAAAYLMKHAGTTAGRTWWPTCPGWPRSCCGSPPTSMSWPAPAAWPTSARRPPSLTGGPNGGAGRAGPGLPGVLPPQQATPVRALLGPVRR